MVRRSVALTRRHGGPQFRTVVLVGLIATAGLTGCGSAGVPPPAAEPPGGTGASATAVPARPGRTAASQPVRFVPREVRLADGARAPVRPAATVAGELRVPEDVAEVGWWDGSAQAGDPFGHTVIAGHVDSATLGLGFFARLLDLGRGDLVRVSGEGHRATYRVASVTAVDQDALAVSSDAFNQRGPHRLVLLTCTGTYDPARGGYSENLVVTAVPVGPPD